jgi:hypothetical protein
MYSYYIMYLYIYRNVIYKIPFLPSHKSHNPGCNGPSPVIDNPLLPFLGEYSSTAAELPFTSCCCCEDFIVTPDVIACCFPPLVEPLLCTKKTILKLN